MWKLWAPVCRRQVLQSTQRNVKIKIQSCSIVPISKRYVSNENSSGGDDKSDEKKHKKVEKKSKEEKKHAAVQKLNTLLSSMKIATSFSDTVAEKDPLQLAKPLNRRKQPKPKVDQEKATGNETELEEEVERLEPEIETAVKDVAQMFGDVSGEVEHELTKKLKEYTDSATGSTDEKPAGPPRNIGDLFAGMKIERSRDQQQAQMNQKAEGWVKASSQVGERLRSQFPEGSVPPYQQRQGLMGIPGIPLKVDIESGKPLNIFYKELLKSPEQEVKLKLWHKLLEDEKRLQMTHPPRNTLEELIMWTKQGKIWRFPIDNEQGMDEEAASTFQQHVFFDDVLEGFPKKGPIFLFMELVCIGLSKNPYITVKQKREHIEWFRQYFKDKEALLKEVGAIE